MRAYTIKRDRAKEGVRLIRARDGEFVIQGEHRRVLMTQPGTGWIKTCEVEVFSIDGLEVSYSLKPSTEASSSILCKVSGHGKVLPLMGEPLKLLDDHLYVLHPNEALLLNAGSLLEGDEGAPTVVECLDATPKVVVGWDKWLDRLDCVWIPRMGLDHVQAVASRHNLPFLKEVLEGKTTRAVVR